MTLAAVAVYVFSGCGGGGAGGSATDQPKMTPEEVQKEIEKLSPPATKGKAKAK